MAPTGSDRAKAVKEFDESKIGVKDLSDSGITSIPPFFVHPTETLSDLKIKSSSSTNASIPLIDLSNVTSENHRPKIVEQIKEAAETWGFFQVIKHGSPVSVLEETVAAIEAFHDLPHEAMAKYYKREEGRGVMYASNNDFYRTNDAGWHDSLQVWTAPEPAKEEDLREICRKEVVAWDLHAAGVAETVMELLSEGLGFERGKFKELTFSESGAVVGHCYLPCRQPDQTMGITPHTHAGIRTVLLPNHVPGLQAGEARQ